MAQTADSPREGRPVSSTVATGRIAWCAFSDATTHSLGELGAAFQQLDGAAGTESTTGLLLRTCHRVEWYEAAPTANAPIAFWLGRRITGHEAAASRLTHIATDVMSLILGEQFVFQQVRAAFNRLPAGHPLRPVGAKVLLLASQARRQFGLHARLDYRDLTRTLLDAPSVRPRNLLVVGGGMLAQSVAQELGDDRRVFLLTRNPKNLRRLLRAGSDRATVLRITDLSDTVRDGGFDLVLATSGITPQYREHIARLVDAAARRLVVDLCAAPVLHERSNYQHLHHPAVTDIIEDANRPAIEAARAASSWIESHYGGRS
ncbi:hypothetical protein ACFRMQ_32380 [Kitasatospora sp. NPDC056783]|uniref:hypothetical protein n=1 Tax=Kitasatospora sp. NPDC056783 TaxID=3345943 RepID=UPI0036C5D15E